MGEGIPFWLPRIDNRYQAALHFSTGDIEGLPSEYFRRNFHITTSGMNYWQPLSMSVDVLGIDKLLYATDYPFEQQGEAVECVERMPLSAAQKQALFETNARRVFGI
jgi:2,3-dihydroxybenzoate decarboxylase